MKRKIFQIHDLQNIQSKALAWAQANAFDVVCYLDRNHYETGWHDAAALLAVQISSAYPLSNCKNQVQNFESFEQFSQFYQQNSQKWLFGFLTYDLKNDIETSLSSQNFDGVGFPNWHFFEPSILLRFQEKELEILIFADNIPPSVAAVFGDAENIWTQIFNLENHFLHTQNIDFQKDELKIEKRFEKEEYLNVIAQLKNHIVEGDFYELNFCQEFFTQNTSIEPFSLFWELNQATQKPFAAFYKYDDRFLLCASPERFLKKVNNKLISQPIKGTSKRGKTPQEDEILKKALQNDPKNRAENVMIVDLVRNDLARVCKIGSVHVSELFGIHTFETVHQLISTVEGELLRGDDATQTAAQIVAALRATFPMGSMTGAPKVMTMQTIEKYERTRRGLYSGAVGYFTPKGDFDFNVVIRSILYNKFNRYLSFQVGGAIIFDSDPESEYEECLVKASAILKVLGIDRVCPI